MTQHAASLTESINTVPLLPSRRARVLVLEDDVTFRSILIELLETEAFDVMVCDSHAALRETVHADRSVVVLADFWGTSHTELSPHERDEIRDLGRQAPTILLSGRAWTRTTDAADLNLMCILPKPVSIEDLIQHIRHCLDIADDAAQ